MRRKKQFLFRHKCRKMLIAASIAALFSTAGFWGMKEAQAEGEELVCQDVYVEVGVQYNNVALSPQIHLSAEKMAGKDYRLNLLYPESRDHAPAAEFQGTVSDKDEIVLEIPSDIAADLEGGEYEIQGDVGEETVSCKVVLVENTMLSDGVEASTEVVSSGGKDISEIYNNTDWNWLAEAGQDYPQVIEINYGFENTIYMASLYSNYGQDFGITNLKLNYMDENGEWQEILNEEGGTEFPQSWQTTDTFQRNDLKFDRPYTTDRLKIIVLSSNENWGQSTNISEFQTWGYIPGKAQPPVEKTEKTNDAKTLQSDIVSEAEDLNALTDGDRDTEFSGTLTEKDYFKFSCQGNKANRKIVFWAKEPQTNLQSVSVKAAAYSDEGMVEIADEKPVVWEKSEDGYKAEITFDVLALTPILYAELNGEGEIALTEVAWEGEEFAQNILKDASFTQDGVSINAGTMTDGSIYSMQEITWSPGSAIEIDFAPYIIDADAFYYAANYGQQQGFAKVKLEGFDGNEWITLADEYTYNWKTNSDLRETQVIEFDKQKLTKIRLTGLEANYVWQHVTVGEFYIRGVRTLSAADMAAKITSIPAPARGDEMLTMPDLGEFSDQFTLSVASTSDEKIVTTEGRIIAPDISQEIYVVLKVQSKDGKDAAYTEKIKVLIPGKITEEDVFREFQEDKENVIYNPSMGWVCYIEDCYRNIDPDTGKFNPEMRTICQGRTVEEYWQEFDAYCSQGLTPHILYIRTVWAWFEPEEGEYAWNDPESELSRLLKGAEERNLQLAFRVLIDSTDNSEQAVPEWVFEAGAEGTVTGSDGLKDAYINDPVFLEKFENFLTAFAERFDNKNTAFIDGFGAGDWGEGNRICYNEALGSRDEASRGIFDLYNSKFDHVLLGAQHGSEADWKYAYENGFVLRRDSLGSPVWFSDADKASINDIFNNGNAVFGESCYHGLNHADGNAGRWQETNQITGWPLEKVLQRVADDGLECRINTLDYRMLSDMECWALDNPAASKEVALSAGYRLSPSYITYSRTISPGEELSIEHAWKNTGVGRMPNNNPKWNYRYRVAFALLDKETGNVVCQLTEDADVDPSTWLKEDADHVYLSKMQIPRSIKAGEYELACAIVNSEEGNIPEINLAVADTACTAEGWYIIDSISVREEGQGGEEGSVPENPEDEDLNTEKDNGSNNNGQQGQAVRTGDVARTELWMALLGSGALIFACSVIYIRRQREEL